MPQDRVPQHKRRLATENKEVKKDIQEKESHKNIKQQPPKDSDKKESGSRRKEE